MRPCFARKLAIITLTSFLIGTAAVAHAQQQYDHYGNFKTIPADAPEVSTAIDALNVEAAEQATGTTAILGGVVSSVKKRANGEIVVDFSRNERLSVHAFVKVKNQDTVPDLTPLIGKPVLVRGLFDDQLGTVEINVDNADQIRVILQANIPEAPLVHIPGGVTVVSASDQACVNWLPIKGAAWYMVLRTTVTQADPHPVARGMKQLTYFDRGLHPGESYEYTVEGFNERGAPVARETTQTTPVHGATVFFDALTDWSNVNDHSANLDFDTVDGVATVKRKKAEPASFVYNLPGTVETAFTVRSIGDSANQVLLESSKNGNEWGPVSVDRTTGLKQTDGSQLSVVHASLPERTNYIRVTLYGNSSSSPSVSALRASYGRTISTSKK